MLPRLHQGNDDIKTKLRVWRAQKCNADVGAETVLTSARPQSTPFHGGQYWVQNGNMRKFGPTNLHGLHQSNVYIKRKLRVWRAQKCNALVGAETVLTSAGQKTTPFHVGQYRAKNGNM